MRAYILIPVSVSRRTCLLFAMPKVRRDNNLYVCLRYTFFATSRVLAICLETPTALKSKYINRYYNVLHNYTLQFMLQLIIEGLIIKFSL